jgi:ABC-type lipoprotein export system ATPase subunit
MSSTIYQRGSLWRKWDLHIHTPFSYHWKGQRLTSTSSDAEKDTIFEAMLKKFNTSSVDVFAVMDYWTAEGFLGFRKYLDSQPRDALKKTILCGVELRVEAPMTPRLNAHVIFSDAMTANEIRGFLAMLRIAVPGESAELPVQQSSFIRYARALDEGKIQECGKTVGDVRTNEETAELVGMMTAKVTRKSLFEALDAHDETTIMLLAWDTHGGIKDLKWRDHAHDDAVLCQRTDMFEARNHEDVALILGRKTPKNEKIIAAFQQSIRGPKAVVSGSDAHQISEYGNFPTPQTTTWVKADPTFSGLRHVLCEPTERCFIGEKPELLRRVESSPSQFMDTIQIDKVTGSSLVEHWFSDVAIPINPGLVAIIGNKGTGKSALADIMANLAGVPPSGMSFLTKERFRQPRVNLASHFAGSLTWCDRQSTPRNLSEDPSQGEPMRTRYLTQGYFDQLCNSLTGSQRGELEDTLDRIVFGHVDESLRNKFLSLQELVDERTRHHQREEEELRGRLSTINSRIAGIEHDLSKGHITTLETALAAREEELHAHDTSRPTPITNPNPTSDNVDAQLELTENPKTTPSGSEENAAPDASPSLEELKTEIASLEDTISTLKAELAAISIKLGIAKRAKEQVEQVQKSFKRHEDELSRTLQELDIAVEEVLTYRIDAGPITTRIAELEAALADVSDKLAPTSELATKLKVAKDKDAEKRSALDESQHKYEEFLRADADWVKRRNSIVGDKTTRESIEGLKERLRWLRDDAPGEVDTLRKDRLDVAAEIYAAFAERRHQLEELYKPTQDRLAAADLGIELGIDLAVNVSSGRFMKNLLDFINLGRRGEFHGSEDAQRKVQDILDKHSLDYWDGTREFLTTFDGLLSKPLTDEGRAIDDQLIQGESVAKLYDYLFGLEWLDLSYGILFSGKPLIALSPGERGVVLLVFYLLLDDTTAPLIIDQPELNLDSESIVRLLVPCIRQMRQRRQIILITHSPNLAVVCDADQIIVASLDRVKGNRVSYACGGIENEEINRAVVNILEGTWPAIDNRYPKYRRLEDSA